MQQQQQQRECENMKCFPSKSNAFALTCVCVINNFSPSTAREWIEKVGKYDFEKERGKNFINHHKSERKLCTSCKNRGIPFVLDAFHLGASVFTESFTVSR